MMTNPMHMVKLVVRMTRLVRRPDRLDDVVAVADQIRTREGSEKLVAWIGRDPTGAVALAERPRLRIDMPALAALPPGTLGRTFHDHMVDNGLDPTALPQRPAWDAIAYASAHLFETHDVWHVVTGFDTDVPGEVGLQAFYLAQVPTRLPPLLLAAAFLNAVFYELDEVGARMDAIVRGWRLGRSARPLFGVRWAEMWDRPLAEVRAGLGITPA
jgi:ubiquinone biosynthesis protein Coq4